MKTETITIPPGTSLNGLANAGTPPDFAELLAGAQVHQSDVILKPPTCLFVEQDGEHLPFGTLGNFSLIKGKAKSRKSFAIGVAVAAALASGPPILQMKGSFPAEKRVVLYFDTEQSRFHVQRAIHRIAALCGFSAPPNLKVYALRRFDPDTRRDAIEWAIYHNEGIGLVVIDGIRDLVHDYNDPKESTATATLLLRWTEEQNIHLLTVLHENKGDSNARGHLGAELTHKAETVLSVTKDAEEKATSIVSAEYCRDKEFEPFGFAIDEHGIPYLVDYLSGGVSNQFPVRHPNGLTASRRPRKPSPHTLNAKQHETLLVNALSGKEPEGYAKTWLRIKLAAGGMGLDVGDNAAKEFLTYYLDTERVTKQPLKNGALYSLTPGPFSSTGLGGLNCDF